MFQNHPVATLVVDQAGMVRAANQAAELLFNRSCASLIGDNVANLLHADARTNVLRIVADSGASARLFAQPLAARSDAAVLADVIIGTEIDDEAGRLIAFHQVPQTSRDTPMRPGAAARSASAAAAMLAHEIKNPLSGIRGAAQLLGRDTAEPGKAMVELIVGEVDRIAALIDSMQAFTRGAAVETIPMNAFTAIGRARDIARAGFGAAAVIEERFDPSIPDVLGNHDALVQVMINLIKNAVEAAGGDRVPSIRLTTAFRHGFYWDSGDGAGPVALTIEIAVLDNGPGVPAALSDALFDPFVSSKSEGQGLGLALVDKLVREMGGIVRHDRIEGWTRFRLWLRPSLTDEQS